jgi:enoyl-CoA hydratase/carnithine racemase
VTSSSDSDEKYSSDFVENTAFEGKRSDKFRAPMLDHEFVIPLRTFDEYKGRYSTQWQLERTDNGVLTAKWHTKGGELQYNLGFHRSLWQLFQDIGQDADTEVLILGGAGQQFLKQFTDIMDERSNMKWMAYEHMFYDGIKNVLTQVNDLRIPTIGVINGSGYHSEWALLCDLTIMAEDAVISDPHFVMQILPGDGIQTTLRELMGIKRANYAMYMNEQIDAEKALAYGLVNEIVPREKIYDRAMEIAQYMMTKPRITRRLTAELVKQPWHEAFAKELRPNFGMEMWSFMANESADHENGFKHILEHEEAYRKLKEEKQRGKPVAKK